MNRLFIFLICAGCTPVGVPAQYPEFARRELAYRCGIVVGSRFIELQPIDETCRQIMREFGDADKIKDE